MRGQFIPTHRLISVAIGATKSVRERIDRVLSGPVEARFQQGRIRLPGNTFKSALVLDISAERDCADYFAQRFGRDVRIIGEESLPDKIEVGDGPRYWALVDMIDGTDLLEMDIPLWCSAIVIFDVRDVKILGAVVGLASGEIYFASAGEPNVAVHRYLHDPDLAHFVETVRGPSQVTILEAAHVCFYGQRASRIVDLAKRQPFIERLTALSREAEFRIYNFAGNPIMVKLVDRLRDEHDTLVGGGFDAVFDTAGQQLHDLVPGAYIATRAGAVLVDLDGKEITEELLAQRLLKPKERMSYVLASTGDLALELVKSLRRAGKASDDQAG